MLLIPTSSPSLERILRAQLRLERLRAIRIFLLTVLAFDGAFVWVDALWPRVATAHGGLFAIVTWPVCFAGYVLVLALERQAEGG